MFNIPSDYYFAIFRVVGKYSPNAISYEVLDRILDINESLPEEFLLENANYFVRNGLTGKLAGYARRNEYNGVLVLLSLA